MLKKIKALCDTRGLSLSQLEKELGFGRDTISKWSTSIPRADRLKAVADYFGVTVDELMEKAEAE